MRVLGGIFGGAAGWIAFLAVAIHGIGTRQSSGAAEPPPLARFTATQPHMGTSFKIVLYARDEASANRGFEAAFARVAELNKILSDYDSHSELSQLSLASPTRAPVPVSQDLWTVLEAAQRFSRKTDGAFDTTVGPLTRLWRRARRQQALPATDRLNEARAAVGYQFVRLDSQHRTAELTRPAMRLDLGGIAKGYAVDQALLALRRCGISQALVNGGGDIGVSDPPPGETEWRVGIAPLEPGDQPGCWVGLRDQAVATSGDAFQYVEFNGRRYSHIIDPRSGQPLTRHSSVSVIAPDCLSADALATSLSVLGPDAGIALVASRPATAALIVLKSDDRVETRSSTRFIDYQRPPPER